MKIKTTVEEALAMVEKLNEVIEGSETNGIITVHFEVSKEEVIKIAKQESANLHEPTSSLPNYWTAIKFENVGVYFQTKELKTKLIFE